MMVVECVVNAAFKVVFFFYIKPDEFRSVCWDTHSVITEKKDKDEHDFKRRVFFLNIPLSHFDSTGVYGRLGGGINHPAVHNNCEALI